MVNTNCAKKRPLSSRPVRPLTEIGQLCHEWTPYPRTGRSVSSCPREMLHQLSSLSLIAKDIGDLLFGDSETQESVRLEARIWELYKRLMHWREALSSSLGVRSDALPSTLALCFNHFRTLIKLRLLVPHKKGGRSCEWQRLRLQQYAVCINRLMGLLT